MSRAITTGPGPVCICPYVGETWHAGVMAWEYHQDWDPACPAHQGITDWAADGTKIVYLDTPPWAKPRQCICQYNPFGAGPWLHLGSTFHIDANCAHHGSVAQVFL